MSSSKKVDIIMPVRNNKQETKDAVMSIIKNTLYLNWELIIVESESTDGTDKILDKLAEKYENIRVFHTKKEGITKAINYGISKSRRGSDIYLTQNDVILPKLYKRDWLTILVEIAEKYKPGLITTIDAGGIDTVGDYLKGFHWVGTWSLYLPRDTINKLGYYEENDN